MKVSLEIGGLVWGFDLIVGNNDCLGLYLQEPTNAVQKICKLIFDLIV